MKIPSYSSKGRGLIYASIIALSFFTLTPSLLFPVFEYLSGFPDWVPKVLISNLLHLFLFVGGNLILFFIYRLESPSIEQYRVEKGEWPWKTDPVGFANLMRKSMKTIFINICILAPSLGVLTTIFDMSPFRMDNYPTWIECTLQIFFFMVVEDTGFYWGHRLMHHPLFYSRFHKQHHEYNTTIGIASEYLSPMDFLICSIIPSNIGTMIIGNSHVVVYWMWIVVRILETIDGHSGYEFPWSPFRLLPMSGSSTYHSFHHSKNRGNFSSLFTYWDTICGTNEEYFKQKAK